jgi:hypothetical protein
MKMGDGFHAPFELAHNFEPVLSQIRTPFRAGVMDVGGAVNSPIADSAPAYTPQIPTGEPTAAGGNGGDVAGAVATVTRKPWRSSAETRPASALI